MSDKEGCFVCEIDLEYLDKVRGNMACLTHMRHDVINNPDKWEKINKLFRDLMKLSILLWNKDWINVKDFLTY